MKKTLLITLDFWPNQGGVANYYYNLVRNLEKDKIFVLTSVFKGNLNQDFKIYNSSLLYKNFWPKWLKCFFESYRIIRKEKIETIWVGNLLPIGIVAFLIKKIFRIPYFVSLHGLDVLLAKKNPWKRFIAKIILENAKFITANSDFTSRILKSFVSNLNIESIYPGIDDKFVDIDEHKKENIIKKYNLSGKKIILSVGRVIKRKNHKLIIESVKILSKEYENFVCIIIGRGDNLDALKDLVKIYNLEKHVLFLENITDEDLPYFYDICDVFVMASINDKDDVEGFGIVYLEAGIFKKVAIASNSGGAKEIIKNNETGYLIDSNNTRELSDKILNIFNDTELAENLGARAYEVVMDNFLWQNIVKKFKNLL